MKILLLAVGALFITLSVSAQSPLEMGMKDCTEAHFFSPGWRTVCEKSVQLAFELNRDGSLNMATMQNFCDSTYIPSAGYSCLMGAAHFIERLRFIKVSPLVEAKKDCDDSHFFFPGWQSICERSAQKAFELSLEGSLSLRTIEIFCDQNFIPSAGPSCLEGGTFYIQRFNEAAVSRKK